jgi:hypothetical protein
MNTKERVVALITTLKNPNLDDVYHCDDENSSIIRFLIKTLTGLETNATPNPSNKALVFEGSSGTILLTLQQNSAGKWFGVGELTQGLNALLAAIRIHEVESYDWVYLPPGTRQNLISSRANEVGVSAQELMRLMTIWTT